MPRVGMTRLRAEATGREGSSVRRELARAVLAGTRESMATQREARGAAAQPEARPEPAGMQPEARREGVAVATRLVETQPEATQEATPQAGKQSYRAAQLRQKP